LDFEAKAVFQYCNHHSNCFPMSKSAGKDTLSVIFHDLGEDILHYDIFQTTLAAILDFGVKIVLKCSKHHSN
jgi:hypothetical protein